MLYKLAADPSSCSNQSGTTGKSIARNAAPSCSVALYVQTTRRATSCVLSSEPTRKVMAGTFTSSPTPTDPTEATPLITCNAGSEAVTTTSQSVAGRNNAFLKRNDRTSVSPVIKSFRPPVVCSFPLTRSSAGCDSVNARAKFTRPRPMLPAYDEFTLSMGSAVVRIWAATCEGVHAGNTPRKIPASPAVYGLEYEVPLPPSPYPPPGKALRMCTPGAKTCTVLP